MNTQVTPVEGKHQVMLRMPVSLHTRLLQSLEPGESVNGKVCELVEREMDRLEKAAARMQAAA